MPRLLSPFTTSVMAGVGEGLFERIAQTVSGQPYLLPAPRLERRDVDERAGPDGRVAEFVIAVEIGPEAAAARPGRLELRQLRPQRLEFLQDLARQLEALCVCGVWCFSPMPEDGRRPSGTLSTGADGLSQIVGEQHVALGESEGGGLGGKGERHRDGQETEATDAQLS